MSIPWRRRQTSKTSSSPTRALPASGCTTRSAATISPRSVVRDMQTLILVAEHDRIVDVPRLEAAMASAPDVSMDVIRQAGHAWSPELSRRQRELIAAFLDDLPLPAATGSAVVAA